MYGHTSAEVPAHTELRKLVVAAVSDGYLLKSTLDNENVVELLRSNADLATDIILNRSNGSKANPVSEQIFTCSYHYTHAGSPLCSYIVCDDIFGQKSCPQCRFEAGSTAKRYLHKISLLTAFPCPFCSGIHTAIPVEPGPEPGPEPEPEPEP